MTVADFAQKILEPTVLAKIKAGAVDAAITSDPDLIEMFDASTPVGNAIRNRLRSLETTTPKAGE